MLDVMRSVSVAGVAFLQVDFCFDSRGFGFGRGLLTLAGVHEEGADQQQMQMNGFHFDSGFGQGKFARYLLFRSAASG